MARFAMSASSCVRNRVSFQTTHFARALMRELDGDDGTVFMWSHHENTILKAIGRQLMEDENPPDDREELLQFSGEPDQRR